MELVKVKRNYQITIPQNLRRIIRLTVGEYVEVDIKDDTLVIRPVKVIHPDQEYFFTKEWQEKEAEADKDIAEGKVVGPFEDVQNALKALKKAIMRLLFTYSFIRDYRALSDQLQKAVDKKLNLFLNNQRHPSLNIKKMQDPRDIWEGRITKGYRFTFRMEGEVCLLRRLGTHDILRTP